MKKNLLFKWVAVLGAVLLLANTSLPGLQVYADSTVIWQWTISNPYWWTVEGLSVKHSWSTLTYSLANWSNCNEDNKFMCRQDWARWAWALITASNDINADNIENVKYRTKDVKIKTDDTEEVISDWSAAKSFNAAKDSGKTYPAYEQFWLSAKASDINTYKEARREIEFDWDWNWTYDQSFSLVIDITTLWLKYNISYNLDWWQNNTDNPTEYIYSSTSEPITLKYPTKEWYVFLWWEWTAQTDISKSPEVIQLTKDVVIPADAYGDRTYTAKWIWQWTISNPYWWTVEGSSVKHSWSTLTYSLANWSNCNEDNKFMCRQDWARWAWALITASNDINADNIENVKYRTKDVKIKTDDTEEVISDWSAAKSFNAAKDSGKTYPAYEQFWLSAKASDINTYKEARREIEFDWDWNWTYDQSFSLVIDITTLWLKYNISYNLDWWQNNTDNPTEYIYSSTSEPITLKYPTKEWYVFLWWEWTAQTDISKSPEVIQLTKDVVIPADAYGDRTYTAKWWYSITLSDVSNWTISSDKAEAKEWDTITLSATPATNYNFWSWTVKDADNNAITVTDNKFTMPAGNVTVTATFSAKPASYSWGGGSSRSSSKTTIADDTKKAEDTAKTDETKADESKSDESKADEAKTSEEAKAAADAQALKDGYSQEFIDAYNFARKNNITTKDTIREADMDAPLTRIAMAKMLSQYAINVLGKTPDTSIVVPTFPDVDAKLDADYNNWVTLAYQLWIMWIGIEKFRPFDLVTRAEFGTALSRMLFGLADWEWDEWYKTHLDKLMEEMIITNDNPNLKELRGYVMIMLMRSAQ